MRALVIRDGVVVVDAFSDPSPGHAEVLVRVRACGVCGSDLHILHHAAARQELDRRMRGMPPRPPEAEVDFGQDVFFGHEFVGEVVGRGPDAGAIPIGAMVTSMPLLRRGNTMVPLSYSNREHCGFGELMTLSTELVRPVPPDVPIDHASLTEPLAVALHAVERADLRHVDGAVVVGCGPVGLTVVAALSLRGVSPIVASDLSAARRSLALRMGADLTLDAKDPEGLAGWLDDNGSDATAIFEATGATGVLDEIARVAPLRSHVVVVGLCMQRDRLHPFFAVRKELRLTFSFGYDGRTFDEALDVIAQRRVDLSPMLSRSVGLEGAGEAMAALARADVCKVTVVP